MPDYRHVLWRERYYNRVGLFCFLFPGYPSEDYPFGRRACDEALDPEPDARDDPRPAPAHRDPAGLPDRLRRGPREALLGPPRAGRRRATAGPSSPGRATAFSCARTRPRLPGLARLTRARPAAGDLRDRRDARRGRDRTSSSSAGGGWPRARPAILLDGRPLENGRRSPNWAVFEADLSAGAHVLELPSHEDGPDPEADYLYFAAVVRRDRGAADRLAP